MFLCLVAESFEYFGAIVAVFASRLKFVSPTVRPLAHPQRVYL
jgi:hypothetical protein